MPLGISCIVAAFVNAISCLSQTRQLRDLFEKRSSRARSPNKGGPCLCCGLVLKQLPSQYSADILARRGKTATAAKNPGSERRTEKAHGAKLRGQSLATFA